ncbi:MAG: hypothetical protein JW774_09455 [Candidatus Aureabacteria bacterium]|nr:hypothetical protein [Candidatus Auribacterota bacterium]
MNEFAPDHHQTHEKPAPFEERFPVRKKRKGQMLVLFAITWPLFLIGMVTVFNIGTLVGERIRIQQIADDAAYSGAVWEARCLNYTAYCNRAIVAQISFLAYLTAAQSHLDAWATIIGYLRIIPPVAPIASAISQVLSTLKDIIKTIKDSSFWDIAISTNSLAEYLMMGYIQIKLNSAMQEVAHDADPDIKLNSGLLSAARLINIANHTAIIQQGKKEDLQYVTRETVSPWTKGQREGQIPIARRTYLALPRWAELWLFYVPINAGIKGNITINNDGISSKDTAFFVMRIIVIRWFIPYPKRKEINIQSFTAKRTINWNNIKFFKFKTGKNNSVGIYAAAEKPSGKLSPILYKHFFQSGLFGMTNYNLFTVPARDLKVKSKAVARYEDPEPNSSRHQKLTNEKKEANIFNPFWHAELVALETTKETDAYPLPNKISLWLFDPYRH